MQFVVDKFHILPLLTSERFPCCGAESAISEFMFLSSPCSSDQFLEGASIHCGMSGLCLHSVYLDGFLLSMEVNDCPVLQDFKECSAFQE